MPIHLVKRIKPRPKSGSIVKALCGEQVKFLESDACPDPCKKCSAALKHLEDSGLISKVPRAPKYEPSVYYVSVFCGSVPTFNSTKLLQR